MIEIECSSLPTEAIHYIGLFNAEKFGKNKPGTVCVQSAEWSLGRLTIRFAYHRRPFVKIHDKRTRRTYKFARHKLVDFGEMLAALNNSHPEHRR